jgi:hypothetical protein
MRRALIWMIVLMSSPAFVLGAHGNQPGEATAEVHGQTVTIVYTAPHLNGRDVNELLQGPRANPWRLGADRPTTLKTPMALQFGDTRLEAGDYTLRAFRDDADHWWLQALDSSREVVGKLPLKRTMSEGSAEYMVISLTPKGHGANFKVQWGTHVLTGDFSMAH